jgi:RNA polymerase sigma-70 factor (ECF subfamily)
MTRRRKLGVIYLTHQLLTNVISQITTLVDRRRFFELEALPWIDDVRRFALSLTRDDAEAEDIVQDTYLRALKSWHTYVPGSDCRRWLFTICRNVFLRTRERSGTTVSLDAADSVGVGAIMRSIARDSRADFEAAQREAEIVPAIRKALALVPQPYRDTVLLVDIQDQTYEFAAARLGVPIGTVRSRLSRGRRIMKEHLWEYAVDSGLARALVQRSA